MHGLAKNSRQCGRSLDGGGLCRERGSDQLRWSAGRWDSLRHDRTDQSNASARTRRTYIESSVDAELVEEIQWSVANYTAVTDVSMTISTSSSSDVKVRAVDYGANSWWASLACEFAGSPTVYGGSETPLPGTRWCKAQVFRYNLFYRASKYPTDNNERSITCQELGHTIGLRHATSCMKTNNQTKITTTAHDRSHVNARY